MIFAFRFAVIAPVCSCLLFEVDKIFLKIENFEGSDQNASCILRLEFLCIQVSSLSRVLSSTRGFSQSFVCLTEGLILTGFFNQDSISDEVRMQLSLSATLG